MEKIILEVGIDEFIVVSGERIETESDTNFYPFGHAVTFRLRPEDAARIGGQNIITVAESEILTDCDLPKATELPASEPAVAPEPTAGGIPTKQLTLFGEQPDQLTLL